MRVGRVAALWRYPVKSMLGEALPWLEMNSRGVLADRLFALRDTDGRLGSGKETSRFRRMPGLFGFRARLDGDTPVIRFPDSTVMRGDDPGVNEALSSVIGREIRLVREGAISHFDSSPVHLLTTSSLRWLQTRMTDSSIDPRRFRPNIVVETDTEETGVLEQNWIGCTVCVGADVQLRIAKVTKRCVMVNFAQYELADDPRILRELADGNEARFGVYAEVAEAGRVHVGDAVTVLCPSSESGNPAA